MRYSTYVPVLALAVFGLSSPVFAQTAPAPAAQNLTPSLPNGGSVAAPSATQAAPAPALPQPIGIAPGAVMPAQPAAAQNPVVAVAPGSFPALPPSRSCKPKDISGVWKLKHVYESPSSQALADFSAQPYQGIIFRPDSTYSESKSPYQSADGVFMASMIQIKMNPQEQYLMDASGFMFFYKNGVAVDTQACFVVVNPLGVFQANDFLLMPPQGQSPTRLVKVYQKMMSLGQLANPQRAGNGNGQGRRRQNQNLLNQQNQQMQNQLNQQQLRQQRRQKRLQQQQLKQQQQQQNLQPQPQLPQPIGTTDGQ